MGDMGPRKPGRRDLRVRPAGRGPRRAAQAQRSDALRAESEGRARAVSCPRHEAGGDGYRPDRRARVMGAIVSAPVPVLTSSLTRASPAPYLPRGSPARTLYRAGEAHRRCALAEKRVDSSSAMNVLGMIAFGKNPGACLLRDGRLVAFAEEERFTRFKGSHGFFPGRSVEYCLQEAGLRLGEVDRIAFAWDAGKYPYHMLASLARQFVRYRGAAARAYHHESNGTRGSMLSAATNVLKYTPGMLRDEIRLGLRAQGLKGDVPPIEFVSHHLCHAYS